MTSRRTSAAPEIQRDGLTDALAQSAFLMMGVLTKVSAEHDLSLTQLRVLAILRGRQLRMTALAEHLGLEKSTLSGLVDRAEKRGLLSRTPSRTDGRSVEISLTSAGVELAARGTDEVRAQLAEIVDTLSGPEQRRLQSLLEKLLGGTPASPRGPNHGPP